MTKEEILKEIAGCCINDQSANEAANRILRLFGVSKRLQTEKQVSCSICGKQYFQSDDFSSLNGKPTCRDCLTTLTLDEDGNVC